MGTKPHERTTARRLARTLRMALAALLCILSSRAGADGNTQGWLEIDREDGITLARRDAPGRNLPDFRGVTIIAADVARIVDELKKVDAHDEWMYRCAESRILKRYSEEHALIYNRTDVPWPIWDRDVILDTWFEWSADRHDVMLHFKNVSSDLMPVPERVVRIPHLEGAYHLRQLAKGRTRVVYQVSADIGGSVPAWIGARVARDMPYQTLFHLRKRIEDAER